jgi:hypothetical protein
LAFGIIGTIWRSQRVLEHIKVLHSLRVEDHVNGVNGLVLDFIDIHAIFT